LTPERLPVLLTVSGTIPDDLDQQVASGRRPRADYRVLAERLGADVVDVPGARAAGGRTGRLLHRVGGAGLLLGWHAFRRRRQYEVIVSDGEQVGLPFALLARLFGRGSSRHVMIVHILSVPKKALLVRAARLAGLIDRYLVYCTSQAEFVRDRLGVSQAHVVLTPFMVDTRFFDPELVPVKPRPMISSAGLERRDYPTMMDAVEGLDVDVVIAAASPWSKRSDSTADRPIPDNVTIQRLDLFALRRLYAESSFVVMPLEDVDFQAGITTILEAMSMARAVVCTRTPGQIDTIDDGRTGVYVPIGDVAALRSVIVELLADRDRCERLGAAARTWAVEHAEVERYADAIAEVVSSLRA
jgi:glycosyltransferase involved in cell wall biosynthesis